MIIAIVQARMGSSRLPGKILMEIAGKPMLWHVVDRVRHAKFVDKVVVATSNAPADDATADFCAANDIEWFRGSENDVLDRFYCVAVHFDASVIVRITADCPLIDPVVIDKVIGEYKKSGCDYAANTIHNTYPDGLDVEVFSINALARTWNEATITSDREHVTPYLRYSGKFSVLSIHADQHELRDEYRWTVDELPDLKFVQEIYRNLYDPDKIFGLGDVMRLLDERPGLKALNRDLIRNEGYYVSIARDPLLMPPDKRNLIRTAAYLKRAEKVIPSQTQTFSKGPNQFVQGVSPAFLEHGEGSHVWDVDGNKYIDYVAALGPIILGYNYPTVTEAVIKQIRRGSTFSLPHPLEVELAELLVELIPCAEMVRFGKNGSDATAGAVRVARAYTGREKIACCGYHGWQDWFIGTTTRNMGVPSSTRELTLPFSYNDIKSLQDLFDVHCNQIAAVIMEPVGLVEPEDNFLSEVNEIAHRNGAVLIFDEVVTGFRLALGGAQELYGVVPDLACFGKAIANGFPLSAVVGRKDVMKFFDEAFFSFTFGGETVSLAAAVATLNEIRENKVLSHIWGQGLKLKDGYNVIARELKIAEHTQCIGLPPHTVMQFSNVDEHDGLILRSLLQQELIKRGVLFLVGNNICFSHSDADIEHTLRAYRAALQYIRESILTGEPAGFLEGPCVQPVFRKP